MKSTVFASLFLLAVALGACTASESKDVVGQDTFDVTGGEVSLDANGLDLAEQDGLLGDAQGEVSLDASGLDLAEQDGLLGDTQGDDAAVVTGAVSVTGVLALVDAPIDPLAYSKYWVGLYAANYEPDEDPTDDILGIVSFAAPENYTGLDFTLPSSENTFLTWDWEAGNGPVLDTPYAAAPGAYTVIVSLDPDATTPGDASHYYYAQVQITEVPFTVELGEVVLAVYTPPAPQD